MASSTSGAGNNVDEIRYRNYLTQMEREHDATIKDKEDDHKSQLQNVISQKEEQKAQIKKDYEVKISDEAEALEKRLNLIRERNQILSTQERELGEREADKVHHQYAQRIDQEKRTGDEQINRLQEYYKKASEDLHKQYNREKSKMAMKGNPK